MQLAKRLHGFQESGYGAIMIVLEAEQHASERREISMRRPAVLSAGTNGEGEVHVQDDVSANPRRPGSR